MERDAALETMPESERALLLAALGTGLADADPAWLETAAARLRNLAVKYRERIKRSRLDARAGRPVEPDAVLRVRLERIETARRRAVDALAAARGRQDPGPVDDAGS